MAKRNKAKFASKSRKSGLRVEALEQRQLLATVTGGGVEVGTDIQHPNGNVYDQVLMTGSAVTVTADWTQNQITRVSFLDKSGDIIQAEFSGKGTLTISLDDFLPAATPVNYNQDVEYVSGLATFTIQGSDATTNFSVFSVGSLNAVNQDLFAGGLTGGNNVADVAAIRIVADPQNPGGFSTFGGIRAGNAVFAADSGTVGIAAANVNVQGPVVIGDIDASDTGVPTLNFGMDSQFSTLIVAGGDLEQTNGAAFVDTAGSFQTINATAGTTSAGVELRSEVIDGAALASIAGVDSATLDATTEFDLTGKTQAQIDDMFAGRTFTEDVTIEGDLGAIFDLDATEFRGGVTFNGDILGDVTVDMGVGSLTITGNVEGEVDIAGDLGALSVTGDVEGEVSALTISEVLVDGDLSGLITTDTNDSNSWNGDEGAIGNVTVTGNVTGGGAVEGVLGIGDILVTGDVDSAGATGGIFVTRSGDDGDEFLANVGTLTVNGTVGTGTGVNVINVTNNGTFGNVTIAGAGAVGRFVAGTDADNTLGVEDSVTGTITITEDEDDVTWGGLEVNSGEGSAGAVTITGGDANTFSLDDSISVLNVDAGDISVTGFAAILIDAAIDAEGADITLATSDSEDSFIGIEAAVGGSADLEAMGSLTATATGTDALVYNIATIGGGADLETIGDISFSSVGDTDDDGSGVAVAAAIAGGASLTTVGAVSLTAEGKDVEVDVSATIGSAGPTLGAITITADGDGSVVDINAVIASEDLAAVTLSAETVDLTGGGQLAADDDSSTIMITGAVTLDGGSILIDDSAGAITIDGDVDFGDAGSLVTDELASLTVTGDATITGAGSIDVGAVSGDITFEGATDVDGTILTGSVTGTLTLTDAVFADGSQVTVAGDLGGLVLDGDTDFSANTGASVALDDGFSGTDVLGSITIDGSYKGAANTPQIVASQVGDITITGTLTQDEALITDIVVLAAPNVAGDDDDTEHVFLDGSNLSDFTIGDITVTSTLNLAFTGTSLFDGENAFVALGAIGDVTLTGGTKGAQQSMLLDEITDSVAFVAGDIDGLDNDTTAAGYTELFLDDADDDDGGATAADPDYTDGAVSIGNVDVNARQSDTTGNNSGVDNIGGLTADSEASLHGLVVLSGVKSTNGSGDIIGMSDQAGDYTAFVEDIDADLAGTVGDILIQSNNAVSFLDTTATAANLIGPDLDADDSLDYMGAIAAATDVGTQQVSGEATDDPGAGVVAVIGDDDAAEDNAVENGDQIVVVIV